jgi:lysyl-tRNA synthetase class 1
MTRLRKYDYLKNSPTNELIKKIECAINWSSDYAKIQSEPIELSTNECNAIKELVEVIPNEKNENGLQNQIFNTAKKYEIKPGRFFQLLYLILIGSPSGPRLGTYIFDLGIEKTTQILRSEIESHC